ncbi:hypothetical protein CerSpe_294710 [Prunus speciosa]
MGFNAVYGCLKEIFPQVDFRLLRAVAIEHPTDADAAVLDVLTELPSLNTQSLSLVSPAQVLHLTGSPVAVDHKEKGKALMYQQVIKEVGVGSLPEPETAAGEDGNKNDHTSGASHDEPTPMEEVLTLHNAPVTADPLRIHTRNEEPISDETGLNFDGKVGLQQSPSCKSTLSMPEKGWVNGILDEPLPAWKNFDFPVHDDSDLVISETCHKVESSAVDSLVEVKSSVAQLDSSFIEHAPDATQCDFHSEFCSGPLLADDNLQATGTSYLTSKQDCSPREMVDIEETTPNNICNIYVLEEIIEDAKNNKKTLFSAMESVISMMREVEVQEKAVDIVKEEASRGGLDITVKVEELKQMLAHAKDANDMHAGEVYGEKAILATEVRELESRLLSLSDERDKSLAILNEMRETLEERLDAATEARKVAEQEKLEKEESARTALAEQEAEMEKVVQASKVLQQEAEENSKLREFLMDRGRIVDMLQGEISVICLDVSLLKEKFDERVPLSQSVSSSQTSCILASSGSSSLKSMGAFDLLLERVESPKFAEKASPASSVDGLSPTSRREDERRELAQALVDEGWEVVVDK